ncbi:MAG: chemosensory pili system protein ChpA (sensor histidine kinase/response regulator), partial [Candidatus Azotimanducaceae bacterium]
MSATQDFVALDWIKKEISQILEQAQHALEKAVEAEDGTSDMRVCLSAIHQVHGTLKMVQLDGPLSIAQEMEELAEALMNNDVEDLEQAQEILMQSILQMPGYLDRIQREQKDNPEFVHPAVNNLRVARGLEGLHEDASGEDVDQFILLSAAPSAEVLEQFRALGGNDTVKKIKQLYQKSLLSILKNNKVKENLVQIGKLFSKLSKTCGESPLGNLSQLGLALIEGVVTSGIKLDSKLVRQLKQIDSVLKAVASGDVKALEVPMPNGLGEDIYSSLKGSVKESPKILLALAKFDAKAPLRDIKVEHVDFGPDDDTLSAVSRILIEEIVTITDKLDLYVRSTNREVSNLFSLMPLMSQVSSTMSVVGLTNHQDNIARQMELIGQIQSSGEDPNDDQLLEIASSLLEIQSALGKIVGSMDGENSLESIGDLDEAQAAVIRETRNSLALCKDAVINYVTSDFDVEKVEKLPEILKNLRGGLSIANQQRSADVLEACASYVTEVLLRDTVKPSLADMDDFADAVTSIDYYLERYLESASDPYLQMVEVAEDAIEKLGFSVKNLGQGSSLNKTVMEQVTEGLNDTIVQSPSAEIALPIENESPFEIEELLAEEIEEPLAKEIEEPSAEIIEEPSAEIIEEPSAEIIEEPSAEIIEEPSAEIIEEPSAEIIEEPSAEIIEEFTDEVIEELSVDEESVSGSEEDDLIDDEIIEIFIEEAEEVLEVISEYLPQWQDDHGDEDARTELRRAFHTLKGSGRMVGATVVAELAWSIENLLNRVIDNTISLSNDILSLIAEVVTQLPQGIEAFKENHQETFVVDHLVQRAEACLTDDDMSTELGSQVLAVIEEPSAEETEEPSAEEIAEPSAEEIAEPSAEEIAEPSAEEIEEFLAEEIEEPSAEIEDSASNIEAFLAEESFDELEEPLLELAESEDAADSLADLEEMLSEDDEFDEDFELGEIEPPSKGLESQHEESPEIDAFFAEMEEPSAEIEEPSAEIEEPSAEIEEPSAVTEDASVELVDSEDIDILESIEELESIEVVGEIDENLLEIDESASDFSLNGLSTVEEIFVPETEIQLVGDAELDGIFIEEANESISIIREYSNAGGLIPSDVVAAYHTLKGSAGMAEVPVVASIAGPMEKLSNQNYVAGIEADDAFLDLVKRSIELMASVTQNLSTKRTSLDELNDFLSQVSLFEASLDDIELPPLFEFDKIVVLSMSSDINWTDLPLEKIIGELKLVQNQSIATKQGYLNRLCEGMLSVYSQIKSKPPVAVIDLLKIAHENLVIVFDHIASSQDVVSFESLVDDLNDVDVEELGLKEELYQYANDSIEALENVGSLFEDWFEDWFEDFNNLLALQQVTIALSELETSADSYGQKDIANLAEPILQLCEKFALGNLVANEEDKALVSSGISALKRQFQALQNSEELLIDESVLGAFRNRLETTAISSPETDDSGEELLLPEDDVEKDILPIFLEEAEELCESIDESILAWSGDTGSNSHLNNLLRHLHTIKGGARLAGLNSLGEYTHNFETFLIGIQQNPTTLNDQFFSLLNSHQDEITRRIEIYNKVAIGGASELELQSLRLVTAPSSADNKLDEEHSFESLSSESSASENADAENQTAESGDIIDLPEDDIDEEILSIFIEEADELIEALDQSILDWSNSPEKSEHFDNLLRHLHTMKGGSRLAGLNSLGEYTHNFETYLTGIKQSADKVSLDDNFFSGLNKHQDEITRRVEVYKKLVQGEASEEDLNSLAQSQDLSVSNQASIKGSDASLDKKVSVETKSEEHEQAAASQPQEMVRVSADLLEDLISLSGEANITRGRIEQQITDFGDSLEEMESTIDRIRDQVRRL